MEVVSAYIGLGSNLQSPIAQVERALVELAELPHSRMIRASSLYRSAPMVADGDLAAQPDYINAVAQIETTLSPHQLLTQLQQLEQQHQRRRERRWGPRSLDLDLLLYGNEIVVSADLQVPHPGLCERSFVLIPLLEIGPNLRLPDNRMLADVVSACSRAGLIAIHNR